MDENKISFLANEIAKTYMTGKIGSQQEFIDTYLEVYEAAKKRIIEMEKQKMNASNISPLDDNMNDSYTQAFSDASKIFK